MRFFMVTTGRWDSGGRSARGTERRRSEDRDVERQGGRSAERQRRGETERDVERDKQEAKQGGRKTRQAQAPLPLKLRPRLHAQQVLHLAHPPR